MQDMLAEDFLQTHEVGINGMDGVAQRRQDVATTGHVKPPFTLMLRILIDGTRALCCGFQQVSTATMESCVSGVARA